MKTKTHAVTAMLLLGALSAFGQTATPIHFSMRTCTGTPQARPITITPLDGALGFYGTNIVAGQTFTLQPVPTPNGVDAVADTNLVIGNYRFTFQGLSKGMQVFWPAISTITNAADPSIQRQGITLVFTVNGGGSGGSNGVSVAPGVLMQASTNSGLVTLSAVSQTNTLYGAVVIGAVGQATQAAHATNADNVSLAVTNQWKSDATAAATAATNTLYGAAVTGAVGQAAHATNADNVSLAVTNQWKADATAAATAATNTLYGAAVSGSVAQATHATNADNVSLAVTNQWKSDAATAAAAVTNGNPFFRVASTNYVTGTNEFAGPQLFDAMTATTPLFFSSGANAWSAIYSNSSFGFWAGLNVGSAPPYGAAIAFKSNSIADGFIGPFFEGSGAPAFIGDGSGLFGNGNGFTNVTAANLLSGLRLTNETFVGGTNNGTIWGTNGQLLTMNSANGVRLDDGQGDVFAASAGVALMTDTANDGVFAHSLNTTNGNISLQDGSGDILLLKSGKLTFNPGSYGSSYVGNANGLTNMPLLGLTNGSSVLPSQFLASDANRGLISTLNGNTLTNLNAANLTGNIGLNQLTNAAPLLNKPGANLSTVTNADGSLTWNALAGGGGGSVADSASIHINTNLGPVYIPQLTSAVSNDFHNANNLNSGSIGINQLTNPIQNGLFTAFNPIQLGTNGNGTLQIGAPSALTNNDNRAGGANFAEDVHGSGIFSPTNGLYLQPLLNTSNSMAMVATNQVYFLNGTNQLVTLLNCTNAATPRFVQYVFTMTNGYGSAIFTNANGFQQIGAIGLQWTNFGPFSVSLVNDGATWWVSGGMLNSTNIPGAVTLSAGTDIAFTDQGTNIVINVSGNLVTNGGNNSFSLVELPNAPTAALKSLSAGANVTLTDQGTNIVIGSTASGGTTGFDVPTNQFSGTTAWLSTNAFISTATNIYFVGIGNSTTTNERWGQLKLYATASITVTNPAFWDTSDWTNSRTVGANQSLYCSFDVQGGVYTSAVFLVTSTNIGGGQIAGSSVVGASTITNGLQSASGSFAGAQITGAINTAGPITSTNGLISFSNNTNWSTGGTASALVGVYTNLAKGVAPNSTFANGSAMWTTNGTSYVMTNNAWLQKN